MKKVTIFILITLALGACYLVWLNDRHWRDIIPIQFDLGSTLHSNSDLQGIREACGVHVFELKESTLNKIEIDGIKFLNTARQARGNKKFYYSYGEWKKTPRKDWERPENWAYELMCTNMPAKLQGIIIDSGRAKGSFYSHGQESVLMIIPDHKIIVLIHNG
ncbi:MAG TPA: hypothetical protein ENJ28_09475 [Gammaproteobacteria bacterium]|nr:hypothetical protein [Gammaproteobacteria bacterium]